MQSEIHLTPGMSVETKDTTCFEKLVIISESKEDRIKIKELHDRLVVSGDIPGAWTVSILQGREGE